MRWPTRGATRQRFQDAATSWRPGSSPSPSLGVARCPCTRSREGRNAECAEGRARIRNRYPVRDRKGAATSSRPAGVGAMRRGHPSCVQSNVVNRADPRRSHSNTMKKEHMVLGTHGWAPARPPHPGFNARKSSGKNNPSFRITSPSNAMVPPPYSGRWMHTRSQWISLRLPLSVSS